MFLNFCFLILYICIRHSCTLEFADLLFLLPPWLALLYKKLKKPFLWPFLLKTNRQKVAQPSSSFPKRPIKFTYKQAKRTVWNYFSGKVCVLAEKFPNSLSLSLWVKVEKHFFWNCNIRFCSGCAIAIGFSSFAKKIWTWNSFILHS